MQVRVAFYGRLREVAGASESEVSVDAASPTVADLAECLREEHPQLAEHLDAAAFAVGDRLVDATRPLEADEEVGVLPPVSGG